MFGLVPALRASRPDLVPALKDSGDGASTRGRFELRDVLVVAQVAVSLVLLVGGALVIRSLAVAGQVDLGYDESRTAYLGVAGEMNELTPQETRVFVETSVERLRRLPQVEAVGLASRVPLSLNNNGFGVFIDGHQESGADRPYIMDGAYVDEGYFRRSEPPGRARPRHRAGRPGRASTRCGGFPSHGEPVLARRISARPRIPHLVGGHTLHHRRGRRGLQSGHPRGVPEVVPAPAARSRDVLRELHREDQYTRCEPSPRI